LVLTNIPLVNIIFRRNPGFHVYFQGGRRRSRHLLLYYTSRGFEGISTCYFLFAASVQQCLAGLCLTQISCGIERLSFVKYAFLLFPPLRSRLPVLLFLRYHRARSDGWNDINGCLACVENYQQSIHPLNNCNYSDNCQCDICRRQPPSLLDSASHILFRCVLDIERFELNSYTTYPQYKYAVQSGRVHDIRLLPPEFPFIQIRCSFSRHAFDAKFHAHCPAREDFNATLRASFVNIETAVQCLLR
jgi:hypothetical protein